ncbi:MAG: recombination mediator RecR [bacterium]
MEHPLSRLIDQFKLLPGIGQKSAERLAFYMLSLSKQKVDVFSDTVKQTRAHVRYCECCYSIAFEARCRLCLDPTRNQRQLCIVADAKSVFSLERMQRFKGVYHVLGGLLSPLDGIHPEVLRLKELLARLRSSSFDEIVLAINPSIEGEATIMYIKSLLAPLSLNVSTLAYGLPVGADLDYIDELTLEKAYIGRSVEEKMSL